MLLQQQHTGHYPISGTIDQQTSCLENMLEECHGQNEQSYCDACTSSVASTKMTLSLTDFIDEAFLW